MPPRIRVRQGDITTFEGDAIVNAANDQLRLGVGVAGAILQAGGATIQAECDQLAPLQLGEAVITGGGQLGVRHVIHAVVMGEEPTTPEVIRRATGAALRVAADYNLARVAMPVLGSGVGRVPVHEAATIMLDTIRTSPYADGVEVVVLFGYRTEDAEVLEELVG